MADRTVPTIVSWTDGQIPSFRDMEANIAAVLDFVMNPPMVRMRQLSTQSVATGTEGNIIWDTLEVETDQMWDAANPTQLKPTIPGWYVGSAKASWSASTVGYRRIDVRKNNSATARTMEVKMGPFPTGGVAGDGVLFLESFNGTTDFITVSSLQTSGGSLANDISSISPQPVVSLRWLAAL